LKNRKKLKKSGKNKIKMLDLFYFLLFGSFEHENELLLISSTGAIIVLIFFIIKYRTKIIDAFRFVKAVYYYVYPAENVHKINFRYYPHSKKLEFSGSINLDLDNNNENSLTNNGSNNDLETIQNQRKIILSRIISDINTSFKLLQKELSEIENNNGKSMVQDINTKLPVSTGGFVNPSNIVGSVNYFLQTSGISDGFSKFVEGFGDELTKTMDNIQRDESFIASTSGMISASGMSSVSRIEEKKSTVIIDDVESDESLEESSDDDSDDDLHTALNH